MKASFENTTVDLSASGTGYTARWEGQIVEVEILQAKDGTLDLLLDGRRLKAHISADGPRRWVTVNGRTFVLAKSSGGGKSRHGPHHPPGQLTAPMPGQVRAIHVREGEAVTKGQTLMLLEAMKMEIRIQSPRDGRVARLFARQGQTVDREQALVEIVDTPEG